MTQLLFLKISRLNSLDGFLTKKDYVTVPTGLHVDPEAITKLVMCQCLKSKCSSRCLFRQSKFIKMNQPMTSCEIYQLMTTITRTSFFSPSYSSTEFVSLMPARCIFMHVSIFRFPIAILTLNSILNMISMFMKFKYGICVHPQRCFLIINMCRINTKQSTSFIQ